MRTIIKAPKKPMTQHAIAACLAAGLVLAATVASAQNLNKREEGRLSVSSCYATCMDRSERTTLALYVRADRLTDLLISDEYHELTEESQNRIVGLEESVICSLAQDHVRGLDTCLAGCADLEEVYGVRSSHARNRFRRLVARASADLRDVGLWRDYRSSPEPGSTAFDRACNVYWDSSSASGSATAASRVRALPSLLRNARQQALQRKKPRQSVLEEPPPTVR